MNKEEALRDFLLRIKHYQDKYEPLDEFREQNLSFMKIYNTGEKVLVHKHEGHVQARIVYYLMNIHIMPRTIYLTRVRLHFIKYLLYFCILAIKVMLCINVSKTAKNRNYYIIKNN